MYLFTKVLTIIDDIGLQRVADAHHQNIRGIAAIAIVFWHTHTQNHIVIVVILYRTLNRLEGIIHAIRLGRRRGRLRQIGGVKRGGSAVGTGLTGIVATGIGTDVIVPDEGILVTHQRPAVVVFIDEPSLAGIEPIVEQSVVVGNQLGVIIDRERIRQNQLHMVKQIGACLTFGGDAAIAVIDFQQGVGDEVIAYRSPDAEVVDGDVSGLNSGSVTHIDDLVALGTAVEHQRGTL